MADTAYLASEASAPEREGGWAGPAQRQESGPRRKPARCRAARLLLGVTEAAGQLPSFLRLQALLRSLLIGNRGEGRSLLRNTEETDGCRFDYSAELHRRDHTHTPVCRALTEDSSRTILCGQFLVELRAAGGVIRLQVHVHGREGGAEPGGLGTRPGGFGSQSFFCT